MSADDADLVTAGVPSRPSPRRCAGAAAWPARREGRLRGEGRPALGPGASLGGVRSSRPTTPGTRTSRGRPVDPRSDAILREHRPGQAAPPRLRHRLPGHAQRHPLRRRRRRRSRRSPSGSSTPTRATPARTRSPPTPRSRAGPKAEGRPPRPGRRPRPLEALRAVLGPTRDGRGWRAGSGAIFDLNSNALRPAGWTSADAAGLPVFPGLVRYDEVVEQGAVRHALRFTCRSRRRRGYVPPPATSPAATTDADLPPMGMRVRLKASFDVSQVPARGAGDPRRVEDVRDAPGRQRRRLVPQRRARPALGRRGPRHAQARQGPRLRGRPDGP